MALEGQENRPLDGVGGPAGDEIARQVQRIAESSLLRGSEPLRRLLQVFLEHAQTHRGEPLKEYAIATLALGRGADYDPRFDATVRVQVGRLRAKLAEYYQGEGANDPVYLEIPRGSYVLLASSRPGGAEDAEEAGQGRRLRWYAGAAVATVCLLLAVAGAAWWRQRPAAPLRQLWGQFTRSAAGPAVVFSNPKFTGRPDTGLRLVQPGENLAGPFDETYTGVGEVFAVHAITANFARFSLPVRPKTAQLFTWDEAKSSDLVVLGSPWQNQPASELPKLTRFVFKPAGQEPVPEKAGILNVDRKGNEEQFFRRRWEGQNSTDYAVVAYMQGVAADRRVLCLQGISTASTQAAAEFVTNPAKVERLLEHLPARGGEPPYFEALIRVAVRRGVPVDSELLMVRTR